jgi:hypothetical protein
MVEHLNRRSGRRLHAGCAVALALACTPVLASSASAASPVLLGTADSFALLAGDRITNVNATTISGNIGVCCTAPTATNGFGSLTQTSGTIFTGPGSPAATATDDLDTAFGNAMVPAATSTLPNDLSVSGTVANPLLPGVYDIAGQAQINTGLWLDFEGDPNAVFIFRGNDLLTAAGPSGSVHIVNGGATPSTCNIYWRLADVSQGVELGANSAFKGTTMSLGASDLGQGASVEGRILSQDSTPIDLDNNTVTRSPCFVAAASGGDTGGTTTTTPPPAATPTPTPTPTTPKPTGAAPSGAAYLSGPGGPVRNPFAVAVTGRRIKSVVYYIDGRRVATVHAKAGRTKFKLKIDPRRQSRRVHQVTARVTFNSNSRTTTTTLRLTYRRPPAARPPRFTG